MNHIKIGDVYVETANQDEHDCYWQVIDPECSYVSCGASEFRPGILMKNTHSDKLVFFSKDFLLEQFDYVKSQEMHKLIGVDNYDRETTSDKLVAEHFTCIHKAERIAKMLNSEGDKSWFYKVVPQSYQLYKFAP